MHLEYTKMHQVVVFQMLLIAATSRGGTAAPRRTQQQWRPLAVRGLTPCRMPIRSSRSPLLQLKYML